MLEGEHRVGGAVQDQGGGGDLFEPGASGDVLVEEEVVGHRGSHVPGSIHLLGCELPVARLVESQASGVRPLGVDPISDHCGPVGPVGFGVGIGERRRDLRRRPGQVACVLGRLPMGWWRPGTGCATGRGAEGRWTARFLHPTTTRPGGRGSHRGRPGFAAGRWPGLPTCMTAARAVSWSTGRCPGGRSGRRVAQRRRAGHKNPSSHQTIDCAPPAINITVASAGSPKVSKHRSVPLMVTVCSVMVRSSSVVAASDVWGCGER